MTGTGRKWMVMAENGCKWLRTTKNCWKWLEMAEKSEMAMTMRMLIMTMPNRMALPYDNFDCLLYITSVSSVGG